MKISNEAKVGLIGIVTLAVLIWGINYLKGRNILSNSYSLVTFFEEASGLETSAPVLLKGYKIGYVDKITLLTKEKDAIRVLLNIEKAYPIPRRSTGELFSADLLGTKAIRILPGTGGELIKDNDTIISVFVPNMISGIQDQVQPVINQVLSLTVTLDTLAQRLDAFLISENSEKTLDHLASISADLKETLSEGGALNQSFENLESFSGMLNEQKEDVASLVGHLNSISASLDSANLGQVAEGLDALAYQFEILLNQVNSEEGTVGKLLYSERLYENLDLLVTDLDSLIVDLRLNPQDYVNISVFGGSKKEK
jgi:phospholipid/cholesterol/gamma-HCH transport system substrate-binding protein